MKTGLISPGNYSAEIRIVPNQCGVRRDWTRVQVVRWISPEPDYSLTNVNQIFTIWDSHIFNH